MSEKTKKAKEKKIEDKVFFVGAGISVDHPSSIPSAYPVTKILCDWLTEGNEIQHHQLLKRCDPRNHYNYFNFVRFETLIQRITQIEPSVLQVLKRLETFGHPNAHHLFLMDAASKGAKIITTNFDTRLEIAAYCSDIDANVFRLSNRNKIPPESARIIKVHGSFPYKKSRNMLPKATLNQIGTIGLGFDRFSKFRNWFENYTKERHVYILGYSASDSFDVVPLLENHCRGKSVTWFEFCPESKGLKTQVISKGDNNVVPPARTQDFVYITLTHLKAISPDADVCRVFGPNLEVFLKNRFGQIYAQKTRLVREFLTPADASHFVEANLKEFRDGLDSLDVSKKGKEIILSLILEEDPFGEEFTKPSSDDYETSESSELYQGVKHYLANGELEIAKEYLEDCKPSMNSKWGVLNEFLEAEVLVALKEGKIAESFEKLERAYLINQDVPEKDPEIFLMFAEGEFNMCHEAGDIEGMSRASRKVLHHARRGGVIWGLILWHNMLARLYHYCFKKGKLKKGIENKVFLRALHHAQQDAYYAVRTGREYWFISAVQLYAFFLYMLGRYSDARKTLDHLLNWINPSSYEEIGATLCSAVTCALLEKKRYIACRYMTKINLISQLEWQEKPIFQSIMEAELAKADGDNKKALDCLDEAENLLSKLAPGDLWDHTFTITQMRQEIHQSRLG